uniref:Uncharacterized protein n=1 Tax=Nothobranchius kadleci TaxID=1051664 RepID=A0A1A8DUH6_NOTKA
MTEEGVEGGGLRRKLTGPPRLLLGRTRTRSSGEDRPDPKGMEISGETSARCSDAAEESKDLETHHNPVGGGQKRSDRWWRRFFSAALWVRKKEARKGLDKPPEEVPLRGDKGGEVVFKEEKFHMRRIFRRFRTSSTDQQIPSKSRDRNTPRSLQKKLQKFFIRGGKRQSVPMKAMEATKVEEDRFAAELIEQQKKETDGTDGTLEATTVPTEMKDQLMEDLASQGPEPPTDTPEEDLPHAGHESEMIQPADITQVLVQVVSSEEDKVFCSSEVTVDLHAPLPTEEKTPQASRPSHPSTNGPSIQIEVCPPEEMEEDTCWGVCSSSENHLFFLLGFHHSEQQLVQMARSLVRTAMAAAVDQVTREQQRDAASGCR